MTLLNQPAITVRLLSLGSFTAGRGLPGGLPSAYNQLFFTENFSERLVESFSFGFQSLDSPQTDALNALNLLNLHKLKRISFSGKTPCSKSQRVANTGL